MKKCIYFCLFFLVSHLNAEPLEDNSFLVEEAYNQEPGIIQFIQVLQKSTKTKNWNYVFINEIPVVNQEYQFSYELPYIYDEAVDKSQLSDIKINLRKEFLRAEQIVTTGRVSLILPTGKNEENSGKGALGYEISLISSVKISNVWSQHWNIGYGITPKAKNSNNISENISKYFYAVNNVYFLTDTINFMLEAVASHSEEIVGVSSKTWNQEIILSPSIRLAFDVSDWQFVPGLAYPMGVGASEGQSQVLGYLSIEDQLF